MCNVIYGWPLGWIYFVFFFFEFRVDSWVTFADTDDVFNAVFVDTKALKLTQKLILRPSSKQTSNYSSELAVKLVLNLSCPILILTKAWGPFVIFGWTNNIKI